MELWKGEIRLMEVEEGDETRLTFDCSFDLDSLVPELRKIKHKYGESVVNSLIYALVGMFERLKIDLLDLIGGEVLI